MINYPRQCITWYRLFVHDKPMNTFGSSSVHDGVRRNYWVNHDGQAANECSQELTYAEPCEGCRWVGVRVIHQHVFEIANA